MNIKLGPPQIADLKPRITVIGIGGAGCNAINNMIATQLDGVEFVVANTDAQSLSMSNAERRIQLGANLTEGLGAGARPEVGEAAAREAEEAIRADIAGSHMVFIAAGMGGGTGTGAAAVVGEIARELGILTVGIVSKPFQFEGARRMRTAEAGLEKLEQAIDTLIVIPNQNLFRIANERTTFAEAFRLADQVLYSGIACIVDLIVKEGLINLDFADVQAVMKGMGTAMMGTGEASGEDRALKAANEAIANPLLDNITLSGAQGLLISIVGGSDLTLYEVDTAASHIRKEVAADANIIVGATTEQGMDERIRVSIVASGMAGQLNAVSEPTASFGAPLPKKSSPEPPPMPPQSSAPTSDEPVISTASFQSEMPSAPPKLPTYADARVAPDESADNSSRDHEHLTGEGEADLDAAEADEFARALSEAMDATAADQTKASDGKDNWQSSDGVVVEEGFADPRGGSRPPPLPEAPGSEGSAMPVGFEPVPPEEVRRATPRMPVVSEFPEVAQREYYAKMEAAQHEAGMQEQREMRRDQRSDDQRMVATADAPPMPLAERPAFPPRSQPAPPPPPPAKPSLLRRLTGAGRK